MWLLSFCSNGCESSQRVSLRKPQIGNADAPAAAPVKKEKPSPAPKRRSGPIFAADTQSPLESKQPRKIDGSTTDTVEESQLVDKNGPSCVKTPLLHKKKEMEAEDDFSFESIPSSRQKRQHVEDIPSHPVDEFTFDNVPSRRKSRKVEDKEADVSFDNIPSSRRKRRSEAVEEDDFSFDNIPSSRKKKQRLGAESVAEDDISFDKIPLGRHAKVESVGSSNESKSQVAVPKSEYVTLQHSDAEVSSTQPETHAKQTDSSPSTSKVEQRAPLQNGEVVLRVYCVIFSEGLPYGVLNFFTSACRDLSISQSFSMSKICLWDFFR